MHRTILLAILFLIPTVGFAADAAQLGLAREVIKAMKADKMLDSMTEQIQQLALQQVNRSAGSASPEAKEQLANMQKEIVAVSMEMAKGLVAKMDEVYADVFSEAELKAMRAFFASPEGQAMLAKQSELMKRMMPMIQEMQRTVAPKVEEIVKKYAPAKPAK